MTDDTLTLDDLPQPVEETTAPPDELHVDGDNPNEQSEEMFGLLVENCREVIERRIGEAKRQREATVNNE